MLRKSNLNFLIANVYNGRVKLVPITADVFGHTLSNLESALYDKTYIASLLQEKQTLAMAKY